MQSVVRNLRIGLVSVAVGFIGCPAIAIAAQMFDSIVKALKESVAGLIGTLFLIVIAAVLIEISAYKFADGGMKITA